MGVAVGEHKHVGLEVGETVEVAVAGIGVNVTVIDGVAVTVNVIVTVRVDVGGTNGVLVLLGAGVKV